MDDISAGVASGALPAVFAPSLRQQHARGGNKSSRRTRNYIIRAAAKRYALNNEVVHCSDLGVDCSSHSRLEFVPTTAAPGKPARKPCSEPTRRRQHLEKTLGFAIDAHGGSDLFRGYRDTGKRHAPRWAIDEGRDLAKSHVQLPSDRARLVRRPTLEREEAFRDASTSRGNVRLRPAIPLIPGDEDAQIAELYRMGLLYDDGDERAAPAFDLNSIPHEEPVYSIRPAKRSRRSNKGRDYDEPLHLDLSFTDLGHDGAIAEFLMPSSSAESSSGEDREEARRTISHSRSSSHSSAPLRVIYELSSSEPSFDVDTSQPPDLIDDDYDLFSDSELDDSPSQREVHDGAAPTPSDAWIMLGDDS
ncbi:hypothetical protein B0I35DRAFT_404693 [Stachybotrys elegans]|uniref:Uncharacterized protein n=1 Tax=Stachybotrys elegans TaxID=80388 RepID=A0A8K0WX92_9HYPO|nr:hypothetical protein B0I35DRAFT_404693 [Stachybotrys elegans]